MTDNETGTKGTKALGEMLKVNKTLTTLKLGSERERWGKEKKKRGRMTDNGIGVEGARSMSEMLKVNKTLTELDLGCEEERKEKGGKKKNEWQ